MSEQQGIRAAAPLGVRSPGSDVDGTGAGATAPRTRLVAAPVALADANRYVAQVHRHNGALPAAKFAVAAVDPTTGAVHGVAIAGIPKARMLMDGATLEVNRVCTDGTFNCCSFLYGCCKRAASALGYTWLLTYTQQGEPGTSLKASGWTEDAGDFGGGAWARENRPHTDATGGTKRRWRIHLNSGPHPSSLEWPWPKEQPCPSLFDITGAA